MTTSVPSALPQPKTGIMEISPYVAGKSKAASDVKKLIKLSSNENSLGPSPKAMEAYKAHADLLFRYPDSSCLKLRESIARIHGLEAEQIVCGSGSDELIGLLVHAYAGAGDEVLYSEHGFLMYKIYAQGNGATPVTAKENNLTTDINALLAAVTERTKIVFVANPNNPTGTYLPASELKRLRNGLPANVLLVIDAAYAEYVDNVDYSAGVELVRESKNTVMLRTFSKIYGLSSLRLGWGYFPASVAEVVNRIRGPFNVSGAAIATGIAAIEDLAYTEHSKQHNTTWRLWLSRELSALSLKVIPSQANFLLVEFPLSKKTSQAANTFLMERGIIPREVVGYGLPQYLRITIGNKEENEALLAALKEFMA